MPSPFTQLQALIRGIAVQAERERARQVQAQDTRAHGSQYEQVFRTMPSGWLFFNHIEDEASKGVWRALNAETGCFDAISKAEVERVLSHHIGNAGMDERREFAYTLRQFQNARRVDPATFDNHDYYLIYDKQVVNCRDRRIEEFDITNPMHKFTRLEPRHRTRVDPASRMVIENILFQIPVMQSKPATVKTFKTPIPDDPVDQAEVLRRWLVNLVWHDWTDRMALLIVGNPNASKTLISGVVAGLLPAQTDVFNFGKIGENGGLNTVYNKSVAVQNEGAGGFLDKETCAKLKDILSQFPKVPIRLLYHNTMSVPISLFMCVASNGLPALDEHFENSAIYKRLAILFCPNQFAKCQSLQDLMQDEEFLDQLFSYLIDAAPQSCNVLDNEEKWWTRNEILYNWSSRPLQWAMQSLYIRTFAVDMEGNERKLRMADVAARIVGYYEERQIPIPKSLREKIHKEAERMGGSYHRSKSGDFLIGIAEKTATQEAPAALSPADKRKIAAAMGGNRI